MATKMKLKEKAYAAIKRKIINFELRPGQVFYETEISRKLGLSRTPIREALNRLEQEALIKRLPTKGYSVVEVTVSEIEELFEIREALEIIALTGAVKKAQEKDWIRIEKKLLSQIVPQEDLSEKNLRRYAKEAQEFDREIVRMSGKETLKQLMELITDKFNRFQWMNIFFRDRVEQSRNEHFEIVNYLKDDKLEEAVTATRKHIRRSRDNILSLLARKKELLYIT